MTARYEGKLVMFTEQGLEGWVCALQDQRGIMPNVHYDPKSEEPMARIPEFHDMKWTIGLKHRDYVEVYERDGTQIWSGHVTKDRNKLKATNYVFHFLPHEIDTAIFLKWFYRELHAVIVRG